MLLNQTIIEKIIEEVRAIAAEEIRPRFRCLNQDEIKTKSSERDLVTIADQNTEAYLTEVFRSLLPPALIVGEEAVSQNPRLLEAITEADLSIIIDPVDGTWNYANGLPIFGVIIAIVQRGETVFGLLYDVLLDDWVRTEKGAGAYFVNNTGSQRLNNSGASVKQKLDGYVPLHMLSDDKRETFAHQINEFGVLSTLRCSCHEYRMVAAGKTDFCLAVSLMPWDHAAGVLAICEAGGAAGLLDGRAYSPTIHKGMLVTTSNRDFYDEIIKKMSALR
ncbi:inositol monophosphatase family protein [Polycladidibacter stylochi]|uniref:inositol monophosphatase family protein n=1 Tax=Polycladidibacter stylochi TaxID=1807766 RepID=UPI0008344423|nr:inositol monophosphatase [Pseudovibrio stylochi]